MSSKGNNEKGKDDDSPSISLRVQKAKKRDIGRNIIRIDPKTMEKLKIQTGDVIAVVGKKESAGIAWPSYPQDNGLGIVRVDSRLQKNTGSNWLGTSGLHRARCLLPRPKPSTAGGTSGVQFRPPECAGGRTADRSPANIAAGSAGANSGLRLCHLRAD